MVLNIWVFIDELIGQGLISEPFERDKMEMNGIKIWVLRSAFARCPVSIEEETISRATARGILLSLGLRDHLEMFSL